MTLPAYVISGPDRVTGRGGASGRGPARGGGYRNVFLVRGICSLAGAPLALFPRSGRRSAADQPMVR